MSEPTIHRHRHDCMATYFEVRLVHENETYARQAARAAFTVADRLERLLSRFREDSEVSQIRMLPCGEVLRISTDTFRCLQIAAEMQVLTGGAFDPGLGEQMDAHRGELPVAGAPVPSPGGRLLMDSENFTVCTQDGPVALDLGAIGKGFALDLMAEKLEAWDVTRALLIAGGSSIMALDGPENSTGWNVSIVPSKTILLKRSAIGTSGIAVKGTHILDPRTGRPAQGPCRVWAVHVSAAIADALSTAWMLLGMDEIGQVCRKLPGTQALLQHGTADAFELVSLGPYDE